MLFAFCPHVLFESLKLQFVVFLPILYCVPLTGSLRSPCWLIFNLVFTVLSNQLHSTDLWGYSASDTEIWTFHIELRFLVASLQVSNGLPYTETVQFCTPATIPDLVS